MVTSQVLTKPIFSKEACQLLPLAQKDKITIEILTDIYHRLIEEDLYKTVFHETPEMTYWNYLQAMTLPSTLVQVFCDIGGEKPQVAGMAWLMALEQTGSGLVKGLGNFCFFRNYHYPDWTSEFGKMCVSYWIDTLEVHSIVGVMPEPNRAAIRYAKRVGFQEVGTLKRHTIFNEEICDAVVTQITAEEWSNHG